MLNLDEHTVTIKEFELLRLFLSHSDMAFTRDQFFNDVLCKRLRHWYFAGTSVKGI